MPTNVEMGCMSPPAPSNKDILLSKCLSTKGWKKEATWTRVCLKNGNLKYKGAFAHQL